MSRTRPIYTHYTSTGASTIDRIYVTETLRENKQDVETAAAAFTDHLVVLLLLILDTQSALRGKGYCRMNVSLLNELAFQTTMQEEWER